MTGLRLNSMTKIPVDVSKGSSAETELHVLNDLKLDASLKHLVFANALAKIFANLCVQAESESSTMSSRAIHDDDSTHNIVRSNSWKKAIEKVRGTASPISPPIAADRALHSFIENLET